MSGLNVSVFSGMVVGESRLSYTKNDTPVLKWTLSIRRFWGGEEQYMPVFLETYGKRAESLADLLVKGARVAVTAEYRYSDWETESGQKRSSVSFVTNEVDIQQYAEEEEDVQDYEEEDIPF